MTDCKQCGLPTQYERGFPTEKDYIRMRERLGELCEAGVLESLGLDETPDCFYHELYRCRHCGYHWRLSVPDQAYRGGLKKIWRPLA